MNSKNIAANYDLPLDVLHIAVGKSRPYEENGHALGVVINFDLQSGAACEAKLNGFKRNGWDNDLSSLARFLALLLSANATDIFNAIQSVN